MANEKEIQAARKLVDHKDFGLMSLTQEFLNIEKLYSDLGMFLSGEDSTLYLSIFFKAIGCGNTVYKLNISLKSENSLESKFLFCAGFEKNNHTDFDENDAKFLELTKQMTARIRPVSSFKGSKKTLLIGEFVASDLAELVKEIEENYNIKKTDEDLADVSGNGFITLKRAKEIYKKCFFCK